MNHLGNANKMVSDTPRTEAEVNRQKCWSDDLITIDANFACQLERELNAANSRIELLMSANADVARIAGERDAAEKRIRLLIAERDTARLQADKKHSLRGEFESLLGTDNIEEGIKAVKEMKERIQRLEEAGDGLMKSINCGCPYGPSVFNCQTCTNSWNAWRKAKEAKP